MQPHTNRYAILSCLAAAVIGAAMLIAQSSLADFGITDTRLKSSLANAFVYNSLPVYPSRKAYAAASPAARVAFVKSALGVVKTYAESAAFKTDYEKLRAQAKPGPSESKGTPDEQWAKFLADQQKSLVEMKANVAKMSPDMQKQMQPTIQQMQASMEKTSKDPQMMAIMKQSYAAEGENSKKDYQRSLAEYETKYPADPIVLIAKRLREFLEMSNGIPFDAKLVGANGHMRFADPKLESKPDQWKLCFRAGKEPVEAARAFASEWLKTLPAK